MKTLRANTRTGLVSFETLKEEYRLFGNRGLIAKAALDEIPARCDPLGPDNKLIIAQSLLAGTTLSTTGRMSVGGKSPLTGGIKEANIGGMIGKALTSHGIKLLIVEGTPTNKEKYVLLIKSSGEAVLVERNDLANMGNYTLVGKLREAYGEDIEALVCGPAGEWLYKNACIMSTDYATKEPCRAAGRGGLGSVMGARGLKAIVVQKADKPYKALPSHPEEYRKATAAFHKSASGNSAIQARTKYGTFGGVRNNEATGVLPVKNFRSIHFDAIDKIDAQAIVDHLDKTGGKYGIACQTGCFIKCSNYFVDENGNHTASAFNYETLGLCGPNLMLDSLDDMAEIKHICDDFGMDTIEMGAAIGVLMEAGIIPWGDGKAAISIAKEIATGGKYSKEIGLGLTAFGEGLGVKRVPEIRGQAFAAYDIRNNKGMGLAYVAGTMGADHTFGSGQPNSDGGYIQGTVFMMNLIAAFDNIFCLFIIQPILMDQDIKTQFFDVLSAYFGEPWDMGRLLKLGNDTLVAEFKFNDAAGLGVVEAPKMFTDEISGVTGSTYDIDPEQAVAIQAVYKGKSLT